MIRARHEGKPHTCQHCREPVVRLQEDGSASVSRWVHTPSRLYCINPVTRQPSGTDAEVAAPMLPVRSPGVVLLRSAVAA
jgi:hypothetical protein